MYILRIYVGAWDNPGWDVVQVEGHLARVCAAAVGILRKEGQLDTRVLASFSVFGPGTPPSFFWTGYMYTRNPTECLPFLSDLGGCAALIL